MATFQHFRECYYRAILIYFNNMLPFLRVSPATLSIKSWGRKAFPAFPSHYLNDFHIRRIQFLFCPGLPVQPNSLSWRNPMPSQNLAFRLDVDKGLDGPFLSVCYSTRWGKMFWVLKASPLLKDIFCSKCLIWNQDFAFFHDITVKHVHYQLCHCGYYLSTTTHLIVFSSWPIRGDIALLRGHRRQEVRQSVQIEDDETL